jgi:5-methylcytosine-specific restriction endonuclease McrA
VKKKEPPKLLRQMAELLKAHPNGLTSGELREKLGLGPTEQAQLDRRRRELKKYYVIEKAGSGNDVRYIYRGEHDAPLEAAVSLARRAQVMHQARGRCGMCGRSKDAHGISLVVDHKIPQDWGGTNDLANLWALCEDCNAGKKNFFASFDPSVMKQVMGYESPHMRIGELLKLHFQKPVPSWLIEFAAFDQDDWKKRLRELRYLGWRIEVPKKKNATTGRTEAFYQLEEFTPWPEGNPSKWIRDYEVKRAELNRKKKG